MPNHVDQHQRGPLLGGEGAQRCRHLQRDVAVSAVVGYLGLAGEQIQRLLVQPG